MKWIHSLYESGLQSQKRLSSVKHKIVSMWSLPEDYKTYNHMSYSEHIY